MTAALLEFPKELVERDRWIGWRLTSDGRKIPVSPITGRPIDVTGTQGAVSFREATRSLGRRQDVNGLGFVFSGDGLVGIDLDDCICDGVPSSSAIKLLNDVGCRYVEVSPSGMGLHGIGVCEEIDTAVKSQRDGVQIEVYCNKRFFTMTGNLVPSITPNGQIAVMDGLPVLLESLRRRPTQDIQATQVSQDIQVTQEIHAMGTFADSKSVVFPSNCIPSGFGWRNRSVFHLARYLKGVIPNSSEDELHKIVVEWFLRYQDRMRTKDFGITWADFLLAWDNVHTPHGTMLTSLLENPRPVPEWMRRHRYGAAADRLLQVCVALAAHHAPNPFFVGVRKLQELTGIDYSDCAKLMKVLVRDGFLELVNKGNRHYAASYRLGSPVKSTR